MASCSTMDYDKFRKEMQAMRVDRAYDLTKWPGYRLNDRHLRIVRDVAGEEIDHIKIIISRACPERFSASELSLLSRNSTLAVVDVSGSNVINDQKLYGLLQSGTRLKQLNLSHCIRVTDDTLFSISEICQELRHLNVSWCLSISDIGLEQLCLRCLKIRYLNISNLMIHGSCLPSVINLPLLQELVMLGSFCNSMDAEIPVTNLTKKRFNFVCDKEFKQNKYRKYFQTISQKFSVMKEPHSVLDILRSTFTLSVESKRRFGEMKHQAKYKFIVFKLDEKLQEILITDLGDSEQSVAHFVTCFPTKNCRYCVCDPGTSTANSLEAKLLWIIWLPHSASKRERILYNLYKDDIKNSFGVERAVVISVIAGLEEVASKMSIDKIAEDKSVYKYQLAEYEMHEPLAISTLYAQPKVAKRPNAAACGKSMTSFKRPKKIDVEGCPNSETEDPRYDQQPER